MCYAEIFRKQSRPLAPIRTGETPVLEELAGIRAVLFDVYGTLVVSGSGEVGTGKPAACAAALAGAFQAVGIAAAEAVGQGVELLDQSIKASHAESRKAGIDYPEVDIVEIWRQVLAQLTRCRLVEPSLGGAVDPKRLAVEYEARANPCWPMPHVEQCLGDLRGRGLLLGIVSNAQFYTPEMIDALLGGPPEMWGFRADLQFFSYRYGRAKPATALLQVAAEALRRAGVCPAEALYVGNDMLNDIFPAAKVGLRTALFAGDRRSLRRREKVRELAGISPDLVLTDLVQLPGCIII